MLVLTQVSSMKTSRVGAILSWCAFQRCRLRAISGLFCSAGRIVFFEAQAFGVNKNPNSARIGLDAARG